MTKDFLLKASIEEFRDKGEEAQAIPCERIITQEGYTYLSLDYENAIGINCAIHLDFDLFNRESAGVNQIVKNIELSTRVNLHEKEYALKYKDIFFFIKRFSGYNETMAQYMYICDAVTADKLEFIGEATEQLGYSSFDLIKGFDSAILPYYFRELDFTDGRIFLEINDSNQETLIRSDGEYLIQTCEDDITLHFINKRRYEVMEYCRNLCDYTVLRETFGIIKMPKIKEKFSDIQSASQIKGASYEANFSISYQLKAKDEAEGYEKYIRKAYYKANFI